MGSRGERIGLVLLLLGVAALHLSFRAFQPEPRVWGDEMHYWAFATNEATLRKANGNLPSLLPGSFGFDHRPQLATRIFSLFADDQGIPAQAPEAMASAAKLVQSAGLMHIALFCLALAAVYGTARTLGLPPRASFTAVLFLGLLPQIGFHLHSLWPETLHLCLASLSVFGIVLHLRTKTLYVLIPAALAFGYALLTKGSLLPLVPVILALLFYEGWRGGSAAGRWRGALVPVTAFVLPAALVVVPQLVANARAGHGATLSANRWWNLELGLTLKADDFSGEGQERFRPLVETSMRYFAAAESPGEREHLARERTLAYLGEHAGSTFVDQFVQSFQLFLFSESSFAQSLSFRERWGALPPSWLRALGSLEWMLWYALMLLSLVGATRVMITGGWRDPGWCFLHLASLAFLAGLFLVPVKFRFLLPLIPLLCLHAGAGIEWICGRLRPGSAEPRSKTLTADPG